MQRAILLSLLVLLSPVAAWPGEGETEKKRRIVYVPHDQMDVLIEKHGRGVILDVSEYLDLWRLARQGKLDRKSPPTLGATILTGRIAGTVFEEKADFEAEYVVRVVKEGIQRVSFPLTDAAVGSVIADGKPALVSRDRHGDYLLLQGKGDHTVTVTFSRKVESKEELRWVGHHVPAGASLTVDVTLPAGMEPVEGTLGGMWRAARTAAGTRVVAHLPPSPRLKIVFRPRRDEGIRESRLHSVGKTLHLVGPRLLRTGSLTEVRIFRAGVRELGFRITGGVRVTDVVAPDLASWRVTENGGESRVFLTLGHEATGTLPVVIAAERTIPGTGDVVLPELRLQDAEDTRGVTAVAYEPGVRGRIVKADGYARVAIPAPRPVAKPKKGQKPPPPEPGPVLSGAAAAYRYWSAERSLEVRTEAREGRVACEAGVVLTVLDQARELHTVFTYSVVGDRLFRVSPVLPKDYELLTLAVTAPTPHTWERSPDGMIVVDFPSGVAPGAAVQVVARLKLETEAWRDESWRERTIPIPVPDAGVGAEVTGRLAVVADTGFDLLDSGLEGLTPEPVERLGFPAARLGYQWRGVGAEGSVTVTRKAPKVSVRHVAIVAPGEKTARYTGFLHYTIQRAGTRRFRFEVSGGLGDRLRVFAPGTTEPVRRPGSAEGVDLWTVELPQKVRGEVLIRLSLEEEMAKVEGSRRFAFPEVRVLDVEDETGYLAVESGDNMQISVSAEGLREIGLEEMVFLGGYAPARGLLAAYSCAAHPWKLSLETTRFQDKEVLAAFVRSAHLISAVAEDGIVRTRATYVLLNLDRQFLRVVLPEGATLWGALVGGKPVKPSEGDGEKLVPLQTTSGGSHVSVVLMYEQQTDPLEGNGTLDLRAPTLKGVTGAEATWDVYLPSDFQVLGSRGVFGGPDRPVRKPWLARVIGRIGSTVVMGGADAARPSATLGAPVEDPVIKDAKFEDHVEAEADEEGMELAKKRSRDKGEPMREAMPPPAAATPPSPEPSDDSKPAEKRPAQGKAGGKPGFVPPPMLGLRGGLSLDIPIVPGGTRESVRALGVDGGVRISYVDAPARNALGYVVSVLVVLVGLFATRLVGPTRGARIPRVAYVVVLLAFATFAPAWFGAREMTVWDAVARGAFWSAIVFSLFSLGRFLAGRPRVAGNSAAALLVLAVLATPAFADGKGKAPTTPADDRETVYVPYDPANPDLDAGGRVFIPFDRYRELWNAAHPDRKIEKPAEAPVPWLLTGAGYEGEVEEETVRLVATYDLVVLTEGWLEIALPLAPAVVDSALVDEKPVRVLSRKGAHVLVLEGKGAHRITLGLRLLLGAKGDARSFSMALPAVPRSLLRFTLPIDDPEIVLDGPVAPDVQGRELTALLGASGRLSLAWRPKTEAPKIEARVEAETREVMTALEGRFEFRLRSTWRVVSGSVREVSLRLDSEFVLLEVKGKDVKSWTVRDGILVIELAREVKNATTVEVLAERADGVRSRGVALPGVAPLGAVRERGLVAVAASPDLRLTLSDSTNLDRIGANPKDFAGLVPAGAALHSAYRFVVRPLGLTVTTEPVQADVRTEIASLHLIERERLRGRVLFVFRVRGDGTFEFPVSFPADLEIDAVNAPGLDHRWRDGDQLWFSTKSPVRGEFRAEVHFRRPLDPDAVQVEIPSLVAVGATHEVSTVVVAHAPGMSLTIVTDEGLVKHDVRSARSWAPIRPDEKRAYAYRPEGDSSRLVVARSFPEARVRPVSTTRLQILDESVVVDTHFAFAIENAGMDTFEVYLPEGEAEDYVLVANRVRRATIADAPDRPGRILTLVLQQEAIGFYGFRIVHEKRLLREEGELRAGRFTVRGLEPLGESPGSYVLVENQSAGEVSFGETDGVERADPAGFPFLPIGPDGKKMDTDLILEAWRGRSAAWSLEVDQVIHGFAEFSDALITSAELLTAIGRDGWSRNRVTYTLLNRTRQFLEITLPEGSQLEAVRVAGRAAKPGRRGEGREERIQIPLVRMQAGDVATTVEVTWSRQIGGRSESVEDLGRLDLLEPTVHGLQVEKTFYTLVLPKGFQYSFDGNMDPVAETAQEVHSLRKEVAQLERLAEEQARGNLAQQVRAGENFLRNRGDVERRWKEAQSSVNRQIGYLADERNLRALSAEQRTQIKKDVEKQLDQLATLKNKLGDLDETVARSGGTRATFFGRGGRNVRAGAKSKAVEQTIAEQKKLVEKQQELSYRFRGKDNVVGQSWGANDAQAAQDALRRMNVYLVQPQGQGEQQQAGQVDTGIQEGWRTAFQQLARSSIAQTGDFISDAPFDGPSTNAAIGVGGGAGGTWAGRSSSHFFGARGDRRRADEDQGAGGGEGGGGAGAGAHRYAGGGGGGGSREPAAATAGLLSLDVTVPTQGETYRFQKQNGGAKLVVAVSGKGGGRGVRSILWFALVMALLFALYRVLARFGVRPGLHTE